MTSIAPLTVDRSERIRTLTQEASRQAPQDTLHLLSAEPDDVVAAVLVELHPPQVLALLPRFDAGRRAAILQAAPPEHRLHWLRNHDYPEGSVGRLMIPVVATFSPTATVHEVVERLRELVKQAFITYGYVIDDHHRLIGVLVMRELLLADSSQIVRELMIEHPFSLRAEQSVSDATPLVLARHYPEYPVCDEQGRILGLVRGYAFFEERTLELTAQPGQMVGVDQEERVHTSWARSLQLRHPWLQVNLLTCFVAAAVVGLFEETISQVVVLAVFLPVLAGQSGNTGCQALAVALRSITLGDFDQHTWRTLVNKEALLGVLNGALGGVTAGLGMYIYASMQGYRSAGLLALVVLLAMVGSCMISSVFGALIPFFLKRVGVDPATASSIFVTTATDVASMGLFLGLATLFIL